MNKRAWRGNSAHQMNIEYSTYLTDFDVGTLKYQKKELRIMMMVQS